MIQIIIYREVLNNFANSLVEVSYNTRKHTVSSDTKFGHPFKLRTFEFTFKTSQEMIIYATYTYSVMQSDRNSFCGNVVLDSFNMSYREEGSILD